MNYRHAFHAGSFADVCKHAVLCRILHYRPRDHLIACELEPQASAALARNLRGHSRIKTLAVDGWIAVRAYVPPKERHGLVLVDSPFEQDAHLRHLSEGVAPAHRKCGAGLILVDPPWTLPDELEILLPALADVLGVAGKYPFRIDWLTGEAPAAPNAFARPRTPRDI